MLRIGLTGGIGAGKSTVSATFNECGGIIVDGDVIAREVVEPGTEGLSALVDAFGDGHPAARRRAEPAGAGGQGVRRRREARQRSTASCTRWWAGGARRSSLRSSDDAVVVEDIPLLVETGMAPMFPLVVVVHADRGDRVDAADQARDGRGRRPRADRRAGHRGAAPRDCRCAAGQLGLAGALVERARDLWYQRVLPLAHNIRTRETVPYPAELVPSDPAWADDAAPDRQPAQDGLRPKGVARRPHRLDGGARDGRQGRHRRPGDRRITRQSPTNSPTLLRESATRASSTSPATFRTTAIRRCGASGFTEPPIRGVPRMFTSGWTAGPTSSSRCCSWTG